MTDQQTVAPPAPPGVPGAESPRRSRGDGSHARNFSPGFVVKLLLVAVVDALGLYGILAAYAVQSWAILTFLVLALVAVNWVYFSKRAVPGKYLIPGLLFLLVYQLFVMAYTGYVAFTNYGDGHNSTKSDAIEAISIQNETRVEGSPTLPLTVVQHDGVLGFAEIAEQQDTITALRVPFSDDPSDGSVRTQDGSTGYVYRSTLEYDAASDTFTDTATGETYTPSSTGNFVSESGDVLTPGWRVGVGFDNFTRVFTDSRLAGPFAQITLWTFAFAALSVLTTFALGLFLAIVFNDPRVRGRKVYRSLLILPYAFPGFLSALVWRGLLTQRFGFI